MYLRKIILKGFKSFPDLTEIETHQGITCIVGPNGCGKSNIGDALRWVLGEQSPSKLRGRKMEDMIFAGTSKRRPEGMTEVVLQIDNSSGYFPTDYTELEITRELFRSGESNYRINKKKQRLSDVNDLFLDRGVGLDNYSIIEQGRVSRIMNAKPLERRQIIEEAAGIVKYQKRREKCERKLRQTQLDIERLNDIITELERQSRSLRQQASRAKRYRELYDRLRSIEIVHFCDEDLRLVAELQALEAALNTLSETSQGLDARRTQISAELEGAELQHNEAEQKLTGLRDQRLTLEGEITGANQQIQLLQRQEEDQAQRRQQLATEHESDDRRLAELATERTTLEQKADEFERIVVDEQQKVTELEEEAGRLKETAAERLREHNEAREEAYRIESKITNLNNSLTQLQREQGQANNRRERVQENLQANAAEAQQVNNGITRLHQELDAREAHRSDADQEKSRTEGNLGELQQQLDTAETQLTEVVGELQSKRVRLEQLESLQKNFEGYRQAVVEVLQRRENGDPQTQQVLGTLASHLQVDRTYARAVESALGEGIQSLVADSGAPVKELLSSSQDGGRLSMICLDHLRLNGTPRLPDNLPFTVTPASQLVQAAAPFDRVAQALLDGVYLVDDIEPCLDALEHMPTGVRFVTREGLVFDVRGVMAGGAGEGAGILARQREIEELRGEVDVLDGRRQEIEQVCETLQTQRRELRQRLQELSDKQYQIDIELATSRKELSAQLRDSDRLAQEAEKYKGELQQIDADLARLAQALAETEAAHAQALEAKEAAAAQLEARATALQTANEQRDEHAAALTQQRLVQSERARDLQVTRQELERNDRNTRELRQRIEQVITTREKLDEAAEHTTRERTRLEEKLQELYTRNESLDREIQDAQYVVAEKDEVCKKTRKALEEVQAERETVNKQLGEKELAINSARMNLNHVHQRVRENYDLEMDAAHQARGEAEPDDNKTLEETAIDLRKRIAQMGSINECAVEDYEKVTEELEFKTAQVNDLEQAKKNLEQTIRQIRKTTRELFMETFNQVRENFQHLFRRVFGGGRADLVLLTDDDTDIMEAGVEVVAQPPGKNLQSISLLSGGEQAMVAIAMIFSLYQIKPSPFCILDEVDAPLDDANVKRFCSIVEDFADKTQFIIVTHNKRTMEMADRLYGVTMPEGGISRLIGMEFETRQGKKRDLRLRMSDLEEEQQQAPADEPQETAAAQETESADATAVNAEAPAQPETAPAAAGADPETTGTAEDEDALVSTDLDEVVPQSAAHPAGDALNEAPRDAEEPADASPAEDDATEHSVEEPADNVTADRHHDEPPEH